MKEESDLEGKLDERKLIKRILKEIIILNLGFLLFQIILFIISLLLLSVEFSSSPFLGLFLLSFALVDFIVFFVYHFIRGGKLKLLEEERFLRFKRGWIFLIVLPVLYFGLTVTTIFIHDMIYYMNSGDIIALFFPLLSSLVTILAAMIPSLISWRDYWWYCNKYNLKK